MIRRRGDYETVSGGEVVRESKNQEGELKRFKSQVEAQQRRGQAFSQASLSIKRSSRSKRGSATRHSDGRIQCDLL